MANSDSYTRKRNKALDSILSQLSVRAQNCCCYIGVETIEELITYACKNDFINIHNCGAKTALELQNTVNAYSSHKSEVEKPEQISLIDNKIKDKQNKEDNSNDSQTPNNIPEEFEELINKVFENSLSNCDNELVLSFMRDKYPTAKSFFKSILHTPLSVFVIKPSFSIDTNVTVWSLQLSILKEFSHSSTTNNNFLRRIYQIYIELKCLFNSRYNSLIISRIPQKAFPLINNEFNAIRERLSTRASNIINKEKLDSIKILDFIDSLKINKTRYKLSGLGYYSIREILEQFKNYKDFILELISHPHQTLERSFIKNQYPFLSEKNIEFVYSFYREKHVYPLFYILYYAIKGATDRKTQIFNSINGITCKTLSLKEVAQLYNLSRERIRQLNHAYKTNFVRNIISRFSSKQYPFLERDIIDIISEKDLISEIEFRDINILSAKAFASIVKLINNYTYYEFGKCKFLISPKLNNIFDWKNAWKDLSITLQQKIVEDTEIPINFFLNYYFLNSISNYNLIRKILVKITRINFNVIIDNNYIIHLKKNSIDIENELYKIIKAAKKPLSLDKIASIFFSLHPDQSHKSITNLKFHMINSERIKSIGKSSTYTLKEWHYSTKTLRNLIVEILTESDLPLKLETIVDVLEIKGRKTSKNSINSSILSDKKNGFVKFKGGLVGLGSKKYAPIYEIQSSESIIRKPFQSRLQDLLNFIDTYHHFPFSSKDELEGSLYRWQKNIEKGIIKVSNSQMIHYQEEIEKRKQYAMTSREYTFSQRCADFKFFVSKNFDLPNQTTEQSLYLWFLKARREASTYTDKKSIFFAELIDFLNQYGFSLK